VRRGRRIPLPFGGLGVVVVMALGLAACGDDDDQAVAEIGDNSVIEYHYGDASVEPESHRSYTLTISPDEVHVVVDSYGDVLQDTTVPLPAEVWTGLAENVGELAAIDSDDGGDGCDGGTSRSMSVTNGSDVVYDLELGVCGGANDDAADRLDAYVAPVIQAVPDWEALVD
jgi:hypothetical protein